MQRIWGTLLFCKESGELCTLLQERPPPTHTHCETRHTINDAAFGPLGGDFVVLDFRRKVNSPEAICLLKTFVSVPCKGPLHRRNFCSTLSFRERQTCPNVTRQKSDLWNDTVCVNFLTAGTHKGWCEACWTHTFVSSVPDC